MIPTTKGKKITKVGALTLTNLLANLMHGDMTCRELAEETGLHYSTVLSYTRAMHKGGVLHITRWEKCSDGRCKIKIYKFGKSKDAAKPLVPRIEQRKRYKEKMKQKELIQMMSGEIRTSI